MRPVTNLPRHVKPEQVCMGDVVRVTLPEASGVIVTRTGRVGKRDYEGSVRVFTTREGTHLFSWVPGEKTPTLTLLERVEHPQEQLSMFTDLERLA
jgi:hypothetical protein